MARRSAGLVLLAGTALAVPAAPTLASDEMPRQSAFAPGLAAIGISDIQRLLRVRGYDAGPATGAMNEATYRAILAYQHDYGLPQDGVAGPLVQNALHFMAPRARPQYAALTPPNFVPQAAPVPPVILPPAPAPAFVPQTPAFAPPAAPAPLAVAPVAAPDAASDAVPKASPSTPVETTPVTDTAPPSTPAPPAAPDQAAAAPPEPAQKPPVPEVAAPATPSEAAASPTPIPTPDAHARGGSCDSGRGRAFARSGCFDSGRGRAGAGDNSGCGRTSRRPRKMVPRPQPSGRSGRGGAKHCRALSGIGRSAGRRGAGDRACRRRRHTSRAGAGAGASAGRRSRGLRAECGGGKRR